MAHTKEKRLPPIHPGEVLQDLLHEAGLTPSSARAREPDCTGDTALRLARYFGTSAQMWMNLQSKYDLALD
jgi:addiction module HigA family antidote